MDDCFNLNKFNRIILNLYFMGCVLVRILLVFFWVFLWLSSPSYAEESHLIYTPQNTAMLQIRFFGVNDGPVTLYEGKPLRSSWDFNQQQKEKILNAARYWAEVITPVNGKLPAIINVGTFNENNAVGDSVRYFNGSTRLTKLQSVLEGFESGELVFGAHAELGIGMMGFDDLSYVPSQLIRTGKMDLTSVSIHELAHGLGISSMILDRFGEGELTPAFSVLQPFDSWTSHLRDDNGNAASPGQQILCHGCNNDDPQGFDVRKDRGYFSGEQVDQVLAGAMPGVPVRMLEDDGSVNNDYMSHIELKNSMMSHQAYSNYFTFMEAELALLQDMGYQIDRRNFFGFSVYGDGQTLVNNKGYFLRNPQGDGSLDGQYNTATLGLGLHVYGSNNIIYQQADLLTRGDGGAGVRIDGKNNTLLVNAGTRIYADGLNGRGVLFAYGSGHQLIQRGDIQALGTSGIGISFDFGHSSQGDDEDYRGSWIHTVAGEAVSLLPELQGALVDNVDISGRVAGKDAAVYIAPSALVSNINILQGAKLEGNIYSEYNQQDEHHQQRLTQFSFGRLIDPLGRATEQPDTYFNFAYSGNIQGINNLALNTIGGMTSLNGEHQIYSMSIEPGSTLSGNSSYQLHQNGRFVNNGLLSPGNSFGKISINGLYQQGSSGQLLLEMDGRGGHDSLVVNGHVELDGQLILAPQRDWYASNWQLNSQDLLAANSYSGEFSDIAILLNSPTLALQAAAQGDKRWQLSMLRKTDAYSQYAKNDNARQVGQALERLVTVAGADLTPLYRTLDFSAVDGRSISQALQRLSPAAYSAMVASSLSREQQIATLVSTLNVSTARQPPATEEWRSFAVPFGAGAWQQQSGNHVGYDAGSYGVVFGAEKQSPSYRDWVVGFHGALSGQSVTLRAPEMATGKTTAFGIGLQARYAADQQAGTYLFGNGRFGVEQGRMERSLAIEDYQAKSHATWNGLSGSMMVGGGYRFALNEELNVGPLVALNYTTLHRPGLTETGLDGSRLALASNNANSLRSSLGMNSYWERALASGAAVKANLQLTWDHELLDVDVSQGASFSNYQSTRFSSNNAVTGRNSVGVKTGVRYITDQQIELGADIASDLFRSDYRSVSGNLSATWRF